MPCVADQGAHAEVEWAHLCEAACCSESGVIAVALQILCKKTQNITAQGIHETFCKGRKSYDCVATFTSPYRPAHLPPHPNWIADGVAMKRVTASNYVQYLSPKGLQAFLTMART